MHEYTEELSHNLIFSFPSYQYISKVATNLLMGCTNLHLLYFCEEFEVQFCCYLLYNHTLLVVHRNLFLQNHGHRSKHILSGNTRRNYWEGCLHPFLASAQDHYSKNKQGPLPHLSAPHSHVFPSDPSQKERGEKERSSHTNTITTTNCRVQ